MSNIEKLFSAIKAADGEACRQMLQDKAVLTQKYKHPDAKFESDVELDAYKFLGAYLGALTPLHFAILLGQDDIARDIIERTYKEDLDETFGGGNTALHLAALLGATNIVALLIERGANITINNQKGFAALDISDDPEIRKLFAK